MLIYPEVGLSWAEVPEAERQRYESRAAAYWDSFYKKNENKFYKDRHYFDREFPELLHGPLRLLEVGCGAGNSVFPLLELNPQLQAFACDFSPRAVQLVQAHPNYASGRVKAFVADITQDDLTAHVPEGSLDFVTMVFVLSAISPEKMHAALANVARVLKPGTGWLMFRDYARGDLAQEKHQTTGVKRLSENFYVRGDGTRCYYFTEPELVQLCGLHGFECQAMKMHERDVENHKRQITMHRRWVQAVFQLRAGSSNAGASTACTSSTPSTANPSASPAAAAGAKPLIPKCEPLPTEECTSVPGSWLVGAAGRLATKLNAPGVPSGRAQLPLSLESADELAKSLNPHGCPASTTQIEEDLDKQFFDAIARDAQEVVQEELASAGGAAIRLAEPLRPVPSLSPPLQSPSTDTVRSQSLPDPEATTTTTTTTTAASATASSTAASTHPGLGTGTGSDNNSFSEVEVSPGFSLGCATPYGPDMELELGLASLLAHCPRLLCQRAVLEMEAGCSGIAAMAAVRSARRVVAAHSSWPPPDRLSINLRLNSPRVVIERLRVCPADLVSNAAQDRTMALRQAPQPPGCFDFIVAAGLIDRCTREATGREQGAEWAAKPSGAEGRAGHGEEEEEEEGKGEEHGPGQGQEEGSLLGALRAARSLVTAQAMGLSSVRPTAASISANSETIGQGQGQGQGQQQQQQQPVVGSMCLLLEAKDVLQRSKGQLQEAAAAAGWAVESGLPEEVADWVTRQGLTSAGTEGFEVVVLVPLLAFG